MLSGSFAERFKLLTGHPPFLWQERLYGLLLAGPPLPALCDLPTGLGKTSVLALWLLALAEQVLRGVPLTLPRRLVYVVNRRVVVDQASDDAAKLLKNLQDAPADSVLAPVALALRGLAALPGDQPFALSTLRGQYADNREWSADPCRPAIIVGTVDMIGSRLLFSAYRAGYKTKPLHAAFLGQDALLVHDEAHLEPAFQKLVEDLADEQRRFGDKCPLRVMQLSATVRAGVAGGEPRAVFELSPEEAAEVEVAKRLNAAKRLELAPPLDDYLKELPGELAELALKHEKSHAAVLIFARTVETVDKVAALLPAGRHEKLTGTMRGKERDTLVGTEVFKRFLPPPKDADASEVSQPPSMARQNGQLSLFSHPEQGESAGMSKEAPDAPVAADLPTVYLVCTSAGEVGVNLSADHMVCDLTTFESMAQRFGRVNRYGLRADTRIDVVPPAKFDTKDDKDSFEARQEKTLRLLGQLQGDASSAALRLLHPDEREAAFSALPGILETSGILFDAWAMTSIREKLPGRPKVEPYLHGVTDREQPTTQVAWREEVGVITGDWLKQFDPTDLLTDYPVKPHEILQDRSDRVWQQLAKLAQKKPDDPTWLVDDGGDVEVFTLAKLLAKKERDKNFINYRLLLLSPDTGGLSKGGTLDGSSDAADDVSGWHPEDQPRRRRGWDAETTAKARAEKMRLIRTVDLSPDSDELLEDEDPAASKRVWRWYELPRKADGDGSEDGEVDVLLKDHISQVADYARRLALKLGLSPELVQAIYLAATFHDLGKQRIPWQRGIGNLNPNLWLAKSGGRRGTHNFGDSYRHEFGSLLDVLSKPELSSALEALPLEMQDLVIHLVAAHHGLARPHFPSANISDIYDPASREELAAETPRRFARLQRRYGRWGLAFLESLLRAADYAASADPQPKPEVTQP